MENVNPTLEEWLQSIGMERFTLLLTGKGVTLEMLATLTDEDLKMHGIILAEDRGRILHQMQLCLAPAVDEAHQSPAPVIPTPNVPQVAAIPAPSIARSRSKAPVYGGPKLARGKTLKPSRGQVPPPPRAQVPPPARAQVFSPAPVQFPPPQIAAVEEEHWHQPAAVASTKPSKRKLFAGNFLLVSIAVHVLLGVGAAYIIVQQMNAKRKITFQGGPPTVNPSKRALEHKVALGQKKKSGGAPAQAKRIATTGVAKISLPEMPAIAVTNDYTPSKMSGMGGMGFGTGMGIGMGNGGGMGGGGGGGGGGINMLPPSLKGRCSTTDRLAKLVQNGGSPKCEDAVNLSLGWLKGKQNSDGSWGANHKAAMTGFALLCYLGRCVTPDDPTYGENVMKGILYLIELSKKNDKGLIATNAAAPSSASIYEHGIATYALGEMYALARLGKKELPGMREAFENGVRFVITQQLASGGWRYYLGGYATEGSADLSVSGWQYQALKAAKLTALPIHGLHQAIDKATKYLKSTQNNTKGGDYLPGGFGNSNGSGAYNMWMLTGVGILGLQTLDKGSGHQAIFNGIKFSSDYFKKNPPNWESNCNLYSWYYYSQAYFQYGGKDWKEWNETAMSLVLANQNSDGAWKMEGTTPQIGVTTAAIGPDSDIYRTCLCTLMLEVYYRYLKVGDH